MDSPIVSTLLADEPEMADLVDSFIDSLPPSVHEIQTAIESQDWAMLKKKIHDVKGLGGNFGYPMLYEVARQFESEISAQAYATLPVLLNELKTICHRIALGKHGL